MALSDYLKRGQIGPSFSRSFYQYERNGRWVTAKWPKPRGKPKSEKQALAQQAFSEVCKAIKRTASEIQMYHRENAKGTPMLPRDSMMAALYGNGPTLTYYSGKVIKPMANKLLASTVLDAIGWQEGDLLYRAGDTWEVLHRPDGHGVLLWDDGLKKPVWGDASGLGTAGYWMTAETNGFNSASRQSKGVGFTMIDTMVLDGVYVATRSMSGKSIDIGLYRLNATNTVTHVVGRWPAGTIPTSDLYRTRFQVPEQVVLEAGQRYALMVQASLSGAGFNIYTCDANWVHPQVPIAPWPGAMIFWGRSIVVGNTLGSEGQPMQAVSMRLK